jgi:hypothetical protein
MNLRNRMQAASDLVSDVVGIVTDVVSNPMEPCSTQAMEERLHVALVMLDVVSETLSAARDLED